MKALHTAWINAEQWVDRYNTLLAAGQANADCAAMRAELDDLFDDIIGAIKDQPRSNVLRWRRNRTAHPVCVANDMALLHRWLEAR